MLNFVVSTNVLHINLKLWKCWNGVNTLALYISDLNYKSYWNVLILLMFHELLLSFHNFSSFVKHQSNTLVRCHAVGINSLFIIFCIFHFAYMFTSSYKSNKNNISRIIFIKIVIIKVNMVKVYRIKAYTITKSTLYHQSLYHH